jgi:hypothetical protein
VVDGPHWLELLSECSFIVKLLEEHAPKAIARNYNAASAQWDSYPSSSLPDSSIASGRHGDPVLTTVVRHAGGKDSGIGDSNAPNLDSETTEDTWKDRYDPIRVAVNRMLSESRDASNRIATAQEAAFVVQGLSGGEVFGICESDDDWQTTLDNLKKGTQALIGHAQDLERMWMDDTQKAALRRLTFQLVDAKNRLRTAERSMREAIPVVIPEKSRELCKSCGVSKDVVTWWGQKPRQWIASEASCRECVERPKRVAKGRAS